jgi:hypothetical protein
MMKNVYWSSCKMPVMFVRFVKKLEFSWQSFEKYTNLKLHENPSSGSRVLTCGQTDGQTDITKLIVAFRNFSNAPKIRNKYPLRKYVRSITA